MAISRERLARLPEILETGRLYLTGARGSGKTTVGRLLAAALGYGFCDLDHYLCSREGRSVSEIVAQDGWDEFRRLESAALVSASIGSNLVFATGGGVILAPENRIFLKASGTVIWLKASAPILNWRLSRNPLAEQRPGLTSLGALGEIEKVLAERERLYADCCTHIVNGSGDPDQVCNEIMEVLGLNG